MIGAERRRKVETVAVRQAPVTDRDDGAERRASRTASAIVPASATAYPAVSNISR